MTCLNLFAGFAVNLLVALVIVRFIYYPVNRNKNYVFTYLAFNTIIYFLVSFLTSTELSLGVGFGLFAIFSVLRYRTTTMSTREMTYLFIVIALPVMNSIIMRAAEWDLLVAANLTMAAVLFVLEREWGLRYETSQSIKFERVDMIRPDQRAQLIEELRRRTGLPVRRVEIGRLNYLNDTAELTVYYDDGRLRQHETYAVTAADTADQLADSV